MNSHTAYLDLHIIINILPILSHNHECVYICVCARTHSFTYYTESLRVSFRHYDHLLISTFMCIS